MRAGELPPPTWSRLPGAHRPVEPRVAAYLRRFDDEARRRAEEIDRRRAAGAELGPLAGVPVALKDNLSLAGDACTCASRILAGYVAPYTATAVERLLAAGAVPSARPTSTSSRWAPRARTRRSRRPATPGTSTPCRAARAAARRRRWRRAACRSALGSDTGGSIRQPAAFCGVVGLKPTYGRVSRYGLVAFASSLDQIGPLARSTRDAALGLAVIAGARPGRRHLRAAAGRRLPRGDRAAGGGHARRRGGRGRRRRRSQPAVRDDWERSLDRLRELGVEIRAVSLPHLPATIAVYYVIANSEASANLARFDGVRYGRRAKSASLLDLYLDSRERGLRPRGQAAHHARHLRALLGLLRRLLRPRRGVRRELERQFSAAFADVDLLLTPTSPTAAFALGEKVDDPLSMYLSDIFTAPTNLAGLPALAAALGQRPGAAAVAPAHGPSVRRGRPAPRRPRLRARDRGSGDAGQPRRHGARDERRAR